ncbi:MAG: DUF1559 domain-containing protein [Janthinobacterium lividum]
MAQYPRKSPPYGIIITIFSFIGVVFAILYPVFQKVRENAYDNCQSNMKQLGLALIQYTQDADNVYPSGVNAAGNGWAEQLYPYIKSTGVYHCPKDAQDGNYISYAENRNIVRQKLAKFANPSTTIAFYEFSTVGCDPSQPETSSATGINAPQDSTRHDSQTFGLNFLMADGSAKYLIPGQVSGGLGAISPKKLPQGAVIETFAVK